VPKVRRWQAIGVAGGLLGFLLLAADDVLQGPVYHLDSLVNGWVSAGVARGLPLHALGGWGSLPGASYATTAAVALCAVVWWRWRERRLAAWAVIGGATAGLAVTLLKLWFQRDRPPFPDAPHSFSFPSGHTLGATATLGILLLLATQVHVDRRRLAGRAADLAWARGIAAWILVSLLVGACRVLAQDHWMSDVLASFCLGLAMVCAVVRVAGIPRPRAKPPPPPERHGPPTAAAKHPPPGRPAGPRRLQARGRRWQWAGLGASLALFALLLADQGLHGPLGRGDQAVYDAVTPWHERGWPVHAVGEALSWPGSVPGTLAITAAVVVTWWLRGARAAAGWAVGGGLAAAGAVTLVKLFVHREPPPFGVAAGASFPSGHTVGAAANLGLLILLEAQVLIDRHGWEGPQAARAWRWALGAWAVAALGTGAARLLAQAHWATDVLAALALGTAVACATLLAARVPRPAKTPAGTPARQV
jgi:undecaprenyl-diphosphatase